VLKTGADIFSLWKPFCLEHWCYYIRRSAAEGDN